MIKRILRRAASVAICCLVTSAAFALQFDETKSERRIREIAEDIGALALGNRDTKRSDRKVEQLSGKAQQVWEDSPARSNKVKAFANATGFEIIHLYDALVDYYVATERRGLAVETLERAVKESYELRYYDHWQNLTLRLIETYVDLGMIDRARLHLHSLETFLTRIGFDLDEHPAEQTRDSVILVQYRTTKLKLGLTGDKTAEQILDDGEYAARLAQKAPEAWGWSDSGGYGYAGEVFPYVKYLVDEGRADLAGQLIPLWREQRRHNLELDPIELLDEADHFANSQLARNLSKALNRLGLNLDTRTIEQLGKPRNLRFRPRSAFLQQYESAALAFARGETRDALDDVVDARRAFEQARDFYDKLDDGFWVIDEMPLNEMELTLLEAQIRQALGQHKDAFELYESYIAASERVRGSLPIEERIYFFRGRSQVAYVGSNATAFDLYRASGNETDLSQFLSGAERMRSRQFRDLIGRDDSESTKQNISPSALQSKLPENAGLVVITELGKRTAVILVTTDKLYVNEIETPATWRTHVFEARNKLASNAPENPALAGISERLLDGLRTPIADLEAMYVLNDGILASLPFPALQLDDDRVIADIGPVTLIPSLDLWLDSFERAFSSKRLLVFADPVYDKDKAINEYVSEELLLATRGSEDLGYFLPLPETRDEADAILNAFQGEQGNRAFFGTDAAESQLKALPNLNEFGYLHFATHGVISGDLPNLEEPALVLAYEDGEDGFLKASEVAALDLNARLTVLSACNTGNGEYFMGEGLMGMGRAFMVAGSQSVVASLWPVESQSTKELMVYFYDALARGASEAEALWQAQLRLRGKSAIAAQRLRGLEVTAPASPTDDASATNYEHPFYWSPFVLISRR